MGDVEVEKKHDGTVEMKVTVKKTPGFYIRSAKRMLEGFEDKDGKKVEPVCVLTISGLGNSINAAIAAAAAVEAEGLGSIKKIEPVTQNSVRKEKAVGVLESRLPYITNESSSEQSDYL
eukprot:CAMPEP_0169137380 /NCGR_PEP_ID=MMETSP1015-20121227/41507_1 /TAXON_ID=342587 /ORGANISM="Karlodinium micrum, Strain CCMP2283" /LENGTH=118 /DNA_ID=CAMNT_0009202219 /DNA_START=73 /DNA_END=430 /DNA_ORIENTATION=-